MYGMTKSIGEKLTIQANMSSTYTDFVCIRGGNVLGSNGSVVPHFINQIKTQNKITITDRTMTRFFLSFKEAMDLIFEAAENSIGGETYVMNMPSFYISDLAEVLIEEYGSKSTIIEEIGAREGEKIHEVLISEHESPNSYWYNNDFYVILPSLKINRDYSDIYDSPKVQFKEFSSADNIKDRDLLKILLKNGNFIK
jgi:FlaA1/EpsC-like NDP-sugar epimerase